MSSQEISMVPSQRLTSNLVFPVSSPLPFNCAAPQRRLSGDPGPKTLQLNGFIHDRYFASQAPEFQRTLYGDHGEGSQDDEEEEPEEEEEEDEEDEVDEGDGEVDGLVGVEDGNKCNNGNNNSNGSVHSNADKVENGKLKHHSSFGLSREVMVKDGGKNARAIPGENHLHLHHHQQQQQQEGRIGSYQNAVTIAEADGDMYYSQYLQAPDGCGAGGQKELVVENGCGFSGRKDSSFSSESGESLRAIFSDPITGALMDDAMILPCGHSFGSGGIQHIIRLKTCYTCSQQISEDLIAPNLSLQAAVQAFHREEELQFYRSNKRKRERYDQEKSNYGDSTLMDPPRGRGVQFPFAVTDRVLIKGNKRTPQRFVGREAVVTTQCLNGWYVVKTLDNAESVKLQYRSLAKVSDDQSSKSTSNKMAPNWL